MSGIIFFGILAIWMFVAIKLTGFFTSGIQSQSKKNWLYPLVLILVFIAPVMDEIIGGFQFRALCTPENMLVYDAKKVRGKTVEYKGVSGHTIYKIIPIRASEIQWFDVTTGEILIKDIRYTARAGWLIRSIGFYPSLNGSCGVTRESDLALEKLNITKIEN